VGLRRNPLLPPSSTAPISILYPTPSNLASRRTTDQFLFWSSPAPFLRKQPVRPIPLSPVFDCRLNIGGRYPLLPLTPPSSVRLCSSLPLFPSVCSHSFQSLTLGYLPLARLPSPPLPRTGSVSHLGPCLRAARQK